MKEFEKYSPTELLKMINDSKTEHDSVKQDIVQYTLELDELEKKINERIEYLNIIEDVYIKLIDELNNRK
jgi:penicillin-binding protein-related factor A (putative recombinase)